jgi:FHA domain
MVVHFGDTCRQARSSARCSVYRQVPARTVSPKRHTVSEQSMFIGQGVRSLCFQAAVAPVLTAVTDTVSVMTLAEPRSFDEMNGMPDMLQLMFRDEGEESARVLWCHSGPVLAGRHDQLRVCSSCPSVSQFHARFEWEQKTRKWKIKDEHSSNGTRLNGKKARAGCKMNLKSGDRLLLGDTLIIDVQVRAP